ncbi:phosphatidylinositol 3,4,5-trisphosphate 5-phosphatase 1 isoform X2 [Entelurus aequoreus]|uniref:phosphatidylinositol 3,4,5-trisphosphate 5-phosphatase 1 isoform X2 n=1 Tax=Entelurus aequoreus TaxID=161455 RepID=UPI002B1D7147|nr:phosphatidylinositol 3,4,5-trisphosphate 5-phosphatase 1 isoform X2 [Entelurus aequoreus]
MQSGQAWCHGNITRSKTEDLLSKAGRDGSFLIRDSESIQGAFALCVLFQNCVYTYRILPNEDKKLSVQASEGVPIRFFSMLPELVEAYQNPSMGLITHLQYAVQREEELEEEPENKDLPPQLPPRDFPAGEVKDGATKSCEQGHKGLSETFLMRLQHMDMSTIAEEQQALILDYFRTSVCLDAEQVQNGNHNLPGLKKLTTAICKNLNGLVKSPASCQPWRFARERWTSNPGQGRDRLRDKFRQIAASLCPSGWNISTKSSTPWRRRYVLPSLGWNLTRVSVHGPLLSFQAKNAVFDSVGYEGGHKKSLIPPVVFEVKQESLGISTKMFMKVDVEGGKLHITKLKDGPDDKYFVHDKIRQLVKSQKMHAKLVIVVETEKEKILRREFVFDNAKKREGFCQLLQQMKNKHSGKPEPDMITVFVGTWNMGNAGPPHGTSSWFQCKGQGRTQDDTADLIPHDIYVVGTQEDPLGEKEWADAVKSVLRSVTNIHFKQVAVHTLWNIRIVVLAKPEHENRISHVCSDSVKTGIANTLGNKGAVGVSFMFNGTAFGFVNSHLTSGSEKKLRRNQNYLNILRFLNLGDKKLNPFDITHRFTHLFWLGDLNYRVDLPNTEAEFMVSRIRQQQYQDLLCRDQLSMERTEQRVFLHFAEEEITFAPTYRFERYTRDKYAYTKAKATGTKYNLPSWCDRILWKSYPLVHVVCQAYGCTNDIMTSDHSPVFASFEVGVASQFVSKRDPNSAPQGGIQIMNCKATLLTKSKTKFFIEYHSSCLEKTVRTCEGENTEHLDGSIKVWFGNQVQLTPIISDAEYLLDQHILICVKSTDSDESYGEGCVALRAAQFCYTEFQVALTHHGENTGVLTGGIQLHTSEGKPTEKLYDFIKVEKDDTKGKSGEANKTSAGQVHDVSNPSYMEVSHRSTNVIAKGWSYSMPPKTLPIAAQAGKDSKKSPTGKPPKPACVEASKMFDNPLYGSTRTAPSQGKDQEKNHLLPPEPTFWPKPPEGPPVPTPRNRSFTCSESKPPTAVAQHKKPVVPSRSQGSASRPPLPAKARPPGPLELQAPKAKDYRDSSELPGKQRAALRAGLTQSQKDPKGDQQ